MLFFEHTGYGYPRKKCESIVCWFIQTYLPRYKVDLTINHRGLKRENVNGWANIEDTNYRPRQFLIEIQSHLSEDEYIATLFHELWHVYQWVKGSLKERGTKRLWRGIDYSETNYFHQPWEIDARQMERVLPILYYRDLTGV